MTPEQCKGARALLGWTQEVLAERSELSPLSILRFEAGRKVGRGVVAQIAQAYLDKVIFIPEDNIAGEGVRLRKGVRPMGPDTVETSNSAKESGSTGISSSPFDDPVRGPVARAVFQRGRWFSLPRQTRRILRAWLFADQNRCERVQPGQ
jgi:transcriptional regulator with XRE-family HTH domain